MQDDQLTSLTDENVVLTVNRRLARELIARFDQLQINSQQQAWRAPVIMPFNSWLIEKARGYVLPENFALLLWQKIIAQSEHGELFICQQQAAIEAFNAWKLVHEYQLDRTKLSNYPNEVTLVWCEWANRYEQLLQEKKWYDSVTCEQVVSLEQQKKRYFVVGFDRITPMQNRILDKLNAQIINHEPAQLKPTVHVVNNTDQEVSAMVQWAKQNSAKNIACVVPNISQRFSELVTEFDKQNCPVNIAASVALKDYPVVASALLALKACAQEVDYSEYSSILRSPYLRDQFEKDAQLREHCGPMVDIKGIENVATPDRETQPARVWANYFIELLAHFGWPGKRVLTSAELQTKKRFEQLLVTFASIELLQDECDQSQALQQLNYLAANTNFQPQSDLANVQVMGLLETAGLQFDAIWLMNMNDETLPEPLMPNNFLPIILQRENKLPHADANSEIHFANNVVARLQSSCSELNVSYAQFDGDREMALSPVFDSPVILNLIQNPDSNARFQLNTTKDDGVAVSDHEKIQGGSYIVKAQAACPFKAFAEIRLQAHALPEPTSGIQAFERGNIVHIILENIWTEISTHAELLTFTDEQIDSHINRVFDNLPTTTAFKIERQRVIRVIKKWLAYEKQRPPFSVVAVEQQQTVTIAGLTINVRIDRIDQLADNNHAIIDYKTGKTDIKNWFGERPLEPQLPLYCLLDEKVSTICFANVRLADCCFNGVSDSSNLIPDTKNATKFATNWADLKKSWRDNITDLITQFLAGDATVDPKDGVTTCEYCACQPLCRIQ